MRTFHTLLLIASVRSMIFGQDWTGAADSDWNNPANWDTWPLNGEDVTIDPDNYTGLAADPSITSNSVFTPDRLRIENGATVWIAADLNVADRISVEGPSIVNMNGGTLGSDRLIVDLGGQFNLLTGTLLLTDRIAISNGDVFGPSRFNMSGGTIASTAELGFECELGTYDPSFTMTGGSVTVNGDVTWFGVAPGSGRPRLSILGGNMDVNGNIENVSGSTVDMSLHVGVGGGLDVNSADIVLVNPADSIVMTGGTFHVYGISTFDTDGVVHTTGGNLYFDLDTELDGNGVYRFGNVTISTGATLAHISPQQIEVQGDWIDLGSFDPQQNTVAFTGISSQLTSGSDYHGLRIANSGSGLYLSGPAQVSGALTLDDGYVQTQSNDLLILLDGATAVSNSLNSYVQGPMKKIGNDDFLFPVGDYGTLRPIAIGGINDQDTELTAEASADPPGNGTALAPDLLALAANGEWSLIRTVTADPVEVTLHWEQNFLVPTVDCDSLVVANWNGSAWLPNVSNTSASCAAPSGWVSAITPFAHVERFAFGVASSALGINALTHGETATLRFDPVLQQLLLVGNGISGRLIVHDALGRECLNRSIRSGAGPIHLKELRPGAYTASLQGATAAHLRFVVQGE